MRTSRYPTKGSSRLAASFLLFGILLSLPANLVATEGSAPQVAPSCEFSFPGGLGPHFDRYSLTLPHTLSIHRTFTFKESGLPRSCRFEIPECGQDDVVDSCDLEEVLLGGTVVALWPETGETVYGTDARHYDGAVFTIAAPEKGHLTVGVLCRDEGAECSSEHQALLNLRRTFTDLANQAGSSSGCENLKN